MLGKEAVGDLAGLVYRLIVALVLYNSPHRGPLRLEGRCTPNDASLHVRAELVEVLLTGRDGDAIGTGRGGPALNLPLEILLEYGSIEVELGRALDKSDKDGLARGGKLLGRTGSAKVSEEARLGG